jgi:ribosomal-protein-alanine N-acetyltransferase
MMVDEAHITTLAVAPDFQGHGLGEILLIALTELSLIENVKVLTLEVRQSNTVAQDLYGKYGFSERGIRPQYYSDDGEDALVMWSEELNSPAFEKRFGNLLAKLENRVTWESRL